MVLGGPAFLHFVVLSSFCLRVSEFRESRESTSLNPMFFKNIANVGSFHFHFHFRIWRIWKIWKSGKSEIKENWKVIWQKPRESRSLTFETEIPKDVLWWPPLSNALATQFWIIHNLNIILRGTNISIIIILRVNNNTKVIAIQGESVTAKKSKLNVRPKTTILQKAYIYCSPDVGSHIKSFLKLLFVNQ